MTAKLSSPTGYGRILRDEKGAVLGIKEEADASSLEKKISEINAGIYCFEIEALLQVLENIKANNQQNEYYLTDAVSFLIQEGHSVDGWAVSNPAEIHGVNDRVALSFAEKVLQKRTNEKLMRNGVSLHLPETILLIPKAILQAM